MSESNSMPLCEILADPSHPMHAELSAFADQVKAGEITPCACLGPLTGEPHCPCEMKRRGLPPSSARVASEEDARRRLAVLVAQGRFRSHA